MPAIRREGSASRSPGRRVRASGGRTCVQPGMVFALYPMERGNAEMNSEDPNAARPQRRGRWYKKGGAGFQAAAALLIVASLSATGFLMVHLVGPPGAAPDT